MKSTTIATNPQFFLTAGGNVLAYGGQYAAFHNVEGDFLRMASLEEAEFLAGVLQPVNFPADRMPDFENPSEWVFLWSVKSSDYSNYRPETCNNGGDYAFYVTTSYYARKTRKGWQFCALDVHGTSAEFDYDEITGNFQSTTWTPVIGASHEIALYVQGDGSPLILDGITKKVGLPFNATDIINDPNDENPMDWAVILPTFSELRRRALRLREIGFTRPNAHQRKGRRGNMSKRR